MTFLPLVNALTSGSISWAPGHPFSQRQVASGPAWVLATCKMEESERRCLSPLSHFSPPSYYFKKQRALRLSMCGNRRARGQGRPARAHTGLTFFCQAARLGGLSSSQLALSLHTLYRAGAPPAGPRETGAEGRGGTPQEGGDARGRPQPNPTAAACPRGAPPSTVPASLSPGIPPQVGAAPTLRFPA